MHIIDVSDSTCLTDFLNSNPKYKVTELTAWKALQDEQTQAFRDIKRDLLDNLPRMQGDDRLAYLSITTMAMFTQDKQWLRMSLYRWFALKNLFTTSTANILEVTYDLNFLTFLNDAIISQEELLIWREKAAASSRSSQSETYIDAKGNTKQKVKKLDAIVPHSSQTFELMILENSLSGPIGNKRARHGIEDRFKLVKVMANSTYKALTDAQLESGFGTIGVHLRQVCEANIEFVAYQVIWTGNQYELHQLFSHALPLCISEGPDTAIECAIDLLTDVAALAKYVKQLAQWKTTRCSPITETKEDTDTKGDQNRENGGDDDAGANNDETKQSTRNTPAKRAPRPPVMKDTPGTRRRAINQHNITPFGYTLSRSAPVGEGHFAKVFAAKHDSSSKEVVLKVQSRGPHVRELHALRQLRDVHCVVSVLNYFHLGGNVFVLVLPRLRTIGFHEVTGNAPAIADFARAAGTAVHELHRHGVAHGDIKPDAFMKGADNTIVLVDFNLSKKVDSRAGFGPDRTSLSGTPGFVFDESPANVHGDGDKIGLAGVVGWLLQVSGFGDPSTDHGFALRCVRTAQRNAIPPESLLLQYVEHLLCLRRPTRWKPTELCKPNTPSTAFTTNGSTSEVSVLSPIVPRYVVLAVRALKSCDGVFSFVTVVGSLGRHLG